MPWIIRAPIFYQENRRIKCNFAKDTKWIRYTSTRIFSWKFSSIFHKDICMVASVAFNKLRGLELPTIYLFHPKHFQGLWLQKTEVFEEIFCEKKALRSFLINLHAILHNEVFFFSMHDSSKFFIDLPSGAYIKNYVNSDSPFKRKFTI